MIKKQDRIIEREQFDVMFTYSEKKKVGKIIVSRVSGGDILQTIKFWEKDRLINREQFSDVCTQWCDNNAA